MLTVNSMTSGRPLNAELIKTSKVRKFFGMRYLKIRVYAQGGNFKWRWGESSWYNPAEVNGYQPSSL